MTLIIVSVTRAEGLRCRNLSRRDQDFWCPATDKSPHFTNKQLVSEMEPPQRAASSSVSARPMLTTASSKALKLQSTPRPTTAGKSLRARNQQHLAGDGSASTADHARRERGKSLHLISNLPPEMKPMPQTTRQGRASIQALEMDLH
jgi:hypothetical protein